MRHAHLQKEEDGGPTVQDTCAGERRHTQVKTLSDADRLARGFWSGACADGLAQYRTPWKMMLPVKSIVVVPIGWLNVS